MAEQSGQTSALTELIRRARRRIVWQLALDQGTVALSAALVGGLLLLFLGTQVLDWYWLALLFGGAFAYGLRRIAGRIPTPYSVAQRLDRSLGLYDALSTAYHFLDPARRSGAETRELQRRQAELLASSIAPEQATPWRAPRGLRLAAVLLLLVCGMFTLRYMVRHNLDLRQPLVRLPFDLFVQDPQLASLEKEYAKKQKEQFRDIGISLEDPDRKGEGLDPAPESALSTVDTPDVNNEDAQSPSKWNEKGEKQDPNAEQGEAGENAEGDSGDKESQGNEAPGDSAGQQSKQQNQQSAKQSQNGENSSLMDKMRDALANLMSKMKLQPKSEGQQSASNTQKGQPSPNSRQQGQKGSQTPGKERTDGPQSEDQQGDQEGESGEKSQNAQGKSGDKASDQQASKDAKSGMGKQDGDKDTQLAEQLAAMGKISEIIGKRAANLTGEVMVEVASGKQQLHTPYSQKRAAHAESGGEIHRDEVPLIFQQYVQQYFEEVRKTPATPAGTADDGQPVPQAQPTPVSPGASATLPGSTVTRPNRQTKTPTARIPSPKQLDR